MTQCRFVFSQNLPSPPSPSNVQIMLPLVVGQVVARIGGWSLTYNQERGLQLTYTCNSPLVWKARELESNSSPAWEARKIYILLLYITIIIYYYVRTLLLMTRGLFPESKYELCPQAKPVLNCAAMLLLIQTHKCRIPLRECSPVCLNIGKCAASPDSINHKISNIPLQGPQLHGQRCSSVLDLICIPDANERLNGSQIQGLRPSPNEIAHGMDQLTLHNVTTAPEFFLKLRNLDDQFLHLCRGRCP